MKQIVLPVTVHLNIRLPLALLQPEPADASTGGKRPSASAGGRPRAGKENRQDHLQGSRPFQQYMLVRYSKTLPVS